VASAGPGSGRRAPASQEKSACCGVPPVRRPRRAAQPADGAGGFPLLALLLAVPLAAICCGGPLLAAALGSALAAAGVWLRGYAGLGLLAAGLGVLLVVRARRTAAAAARRPRFAPEARGGEER
jgi:hypothetical protein